MMAPQQKAWIYTKEQLMTPVKPGGIPYAMATKYRKEMYQFMLEISKALKIPQLTTSTAAVYFHRFYSRKDFTEYDAYDAALVCFFLAAKVEETHAKLRDVIITGWHIRHKQRLSINSSEFLAIRDRLLVLERILLQTIMFDLCIEHPYKYVLEQAKLLCGSRAHKDFAQTAWNLVNDSYASTVSLQYPPDAIAAAAIHLASKLHKMDLTSCAGQQPWYQKIGVTPEQLDLIAEQILDSFDQPPLLRESLSKPSQETAIVKSETRPPEVTP